MFHRYPARETRRKGCLLFGLASTLVSSITSHNTPDNTILYNVLTYQSEHYLKQVFCVFKSQKLKNRTFRVKLLIIRNRINETYSNCCIEPSLRHCERPFYTVAYGKLRTQVIFILISFLGAVVFNNIVKLEI